MSILKSIKKYFNAFRTDKFSIRNKGSWINYFLIVVGIMGFTFLLFSNIFVQDRIVDAHTKVGSFHSLGSSSNSVKINKWELNKKQNTLDVVLEYKNKDLISNTEEEEEYSYKFSPNNSPDSKLKYKEISKESNKEAIRVYNVHDGFEVIGMTIYGKEKNSSDPKEKHIVLLGNENKVSISKDNKLKNKQDYLLEFIKNDQREVENSIEDNQKKIQTHEDKIDNLNKDISKKDEEKTYQTKSEKQVTDSKISGLKDEIEEEKLSIKDKKESITEEEETIKLLESKYKDTKQFTE